MLIRTVPSALHAADRDADPGYPLHLPADESLFVVDTPPSYTTMSTSNYKASFAKNIRLFDHHQSYAIARDEV